MSATAEWESWLSVGLGVHLSPGLAMTSTVHADEGRVVLRLLGTNFVDLSLFANRVELDRLHAAVTEARANLDAATGTNAAHAA